MAWSGALSTAAGTPTAFMDDEKGPECDALKRPKRGREAHVDVPTTCALNPCSGVEPNASDVPSAAPFSALGPQSGARNQLGK